MRHILRSASVWFALLPAMASAQVYLPSNVGLPPQSVIGNALPNQGDAVAVPFAQLKAGLGVPQAQSCSSHNWFNSISSLGILGCTQPAAVDISGLAASATTDTTNASNISSGTLAAARGGAGTISGALKGNGAGLVTQAACADLSNAAASCSTDTTNAANISTGTLPNARLTAGQFPGTATNDSATAGNIGEFISASATSVALTTATPKDLTSISLTAGDWDVSAGMTFSGGSSPVVTDVWASINLVTATPVNTAGQAFRLRGFSMTDPSISGSIAPFRMSISTTTTVFLSAQATYSPGTFSGNGIIRARRMR